MKNILFIEGIATATGSTHSHVQEDDSDSISMIQVDNRIKKKIYPYYMMKGHPDPRMLGMLETEHDLLSSDLDSSSSSSSDKISRIVKKVARKIQKLEAQINAPAPKAKDAPAPAPAAAPAPAPKDAPPPGTFTELRKTIQVHVILLCCCKKADKIRV